MKVGLFVAGGILILIAIVVPSVTVRSSRQLSDDDEAVRPLDPRFIYDESSAEMRSVRKALKEVPLIDR
jgi:hypothetical protein